MPFPLVYFFFLFSIFIHHIISYITVYFYFPSVSSAPCYIILNQLSFFISLLHFLRLYKYSLFHLRFDFSVLSSVPMRIFSVFVSPPTRYLGVNSHVLPPSVSFLHCFYFFSCYICTPKSPLHVV